MDSMITSKDIKQKEYLDIVETIKSSLFPNMNLKQILWNETFYCQDLSATSKCLLKMIFFRTAVLDLKISGNDLLCLYTKNYRNDHDEYWEKIKQDSGTHDDITIKWRDLRLDLFSSIKKLVWYRIAKKELQKIPSNNDKIYLACRMVGRKWVLEEIEKLNLKPKVVMCFFDSSPDENVLMQYFKSLGAITITNQHGQSVYQSTEYDRVNQSQILNFKCDYYFAKGEKQIEQFLKAGFSNEMFRKIGIVGAQKISFKHNDTMCFGVYLDTPGLSFSERINPRMIETAKIVAKELGYKYIIKTHPTEENGKYDSLVDENCIGLFGKDSTLIDTLKRVDFGITHASSTYVDVYVYGWRCYRMKTEIPYPLSNEEDEFVDATEIEEKIKKWLILDAKERETYINKVRLLYDSGWIEGTVEKTINSILEQR